MNNDIMSIFHKIKNSIKFYNEYMTVRFGLNVKVLSESRGILSAFRHDSAWISSMSTTLPGRSPMSVAIGTTTWLIPVRSIAMSIIRRRIRIRIMARGFLPHLGHTLYNSYTKYPGKINLGVLYVSCSMEAMRYE